MTLQAFPFNHIIAVDVAKAHLDIFILPGERRWRIANKSGAISRLLADELRRNAKQDLGSTLMICEATGGYERDLLARAQAREIACHRAHGRRLRDFARAMGKRAKTDRIDAELLAQFAQKCEDLTLYRPPSPDQEHLRQLCERRNDLLGMRLAEQNRCELAADPWVKKSLRRVVNLLARQLKDIKIEIARTMSQNNDLDQAAKLLQSLKAVGPVTSATILAHMPELGTLSKAEAAALTGLAPYNRDSGFSNAPRHIHAGRAQVRRCLFMAATVAIQHNPVLKAHFDNLRQRGKPHKVALVAVMRKMIVILNAILKEGKPWKHAQTA